MGRQRLASKPPEYSRRSVQEAFLSVSPVHPSCQAGCVFPLPVCVCTLLVLENTVLKLRYLVKFITACDHLPLVTYESCPFFSEILDHVYTE